MEMSMQMDKPHSSWAKKTLPVFILLVVILGPISIQNSSADVLLNLALAQTTPTCTAGTLVTPQQNPNLFASGTAGSGAAYACGVTSGVTDLGANVQYNFFNNDGTPFGQANTSINGTTASVNQTAQNGQAITTTDCSTLTSLINPTCLWRSGVTWLGALLIWVAVSIATITGWLFNVAINWTVLGFNAWVTGTTLQAITAGWTFFRDIGNILIIGLFVFIAINLILGNKTYGDRKLIARVLVVAVLINFSFLFTRIIIDFSNALAVQFAKTAPLSATYAGAGSDPTDISGKFTALMGVDGLKNTGNALQDIAKNNDGALITLLHALIVTVVLLGVALVLLYGAILLLMRAIVFIFLLVTSSLAFATYLHPSLASSEYGWKAWWEALFRNALLAPLMMLFLVVTLKIGNGMLTTLNGSATAAGKGALGALADSPNASNVSAFLFYALILGLLYGGIRISNRFSGIAGQFAWSGTLPFANATVAWPSRSLGFLGRNSVGRGAAALGANLQKRAVAANIRNPGGTGQFVWDKLAQGVKSVAKRDFNAGNLTGVKSAQTKLGGFEGQEKRRHDAILERQKRTTPSKEELKVSADALKKAREEADPVTGQKRGDAYNSNQKALEAAKKMEEAAKQQVDAASKSADAISKQIKTLETRRDTATSENKQIIEKEIDRKKGDMEQARNAIARAESNARDQSTKVVNLELEGRNLKEMLDKRAAQFMPEGHEYIPEEKHQSFNKALEENAVQDAYKRLSNTLNRVAGVPIENDSFAQSFRKATKDALHQDEEKKPNEKLGKQIEGLTETIKRMAEQQHEQTAKTNEYLKEIKNNSNNK